MLIMLLEWLYAWSNRKARREKSPSEPFSLSGARGESEAGCGKKLGEEQRSRVMSGAERLHPFEFVSTCLPVCS